MAFRRFLVLGDERNVQAARGALALEVDGQKQFPGAYQRAARKGLPHDVVWVEWVREDPLWSGAADGAYAGPHFRELEGVGLTRYSTGDNGACPAAAVFSPSNCKGPDCSKQATEQCFRIVNSKPLFPHGRRRNVTKLGPGAKKRN